MDPERAEKDAPKKLSPAKRALFSIALIVVLVPVTEGLFRLTQKHRDYDLWRKRSLRYTYDPHFHWRIRPGEYIHRKSGNTECINSIGLRCPELSKKKPEGTIRIIALGGSSTYIVSPLTGESYTDILERLLEERTGKQFQVVNAGTPGYSAYQSSMRLKHELIDYDPDLVTIYNLSNDMKIFAMTDPASMIKKWDAHGKANEAVTLLNPNPVLDELCRWSQMVTHLRFKFIKARIKRAEAGDEGWYYDSYELKPAEEGIEFYLDNHRRIIDTLRPRGIPLVIIKQATLVGPDNSPEDIAEIRYDYFGFNHERMLQAYHMAWDALGELCETDNVYCVNRGTDIPHTVLYFDDEVHLTDKGRETLARIIADDLMDFFDGFRDFPKDRAAEKERAPSP